MPRQCALLNSLWLSIVLVLQPVTASWGMTTVAKLIASPSGTGGFDYMRIDQKDRKLLAAHRQAGSLDVVDLDSGAVSTAKVGHIQGIDFDERGHYFAGAQSEEKLVVLDARDLSVLKEIKTAGPIDGIAYCPKNEMVYADHDDGSDLWVVDPKAGKVVATIEVGGEAEFIAFNPADQLLYQNVKTTNLVAVIDPASNKVLEKWSTLPAQSPHGLAIDPQSGYLFSAGRNGKLVIFDLQKKAQIGCVDIAEGVDQIVFDPGQKRIYCACKGFISVVEETERGAKFLKNIPDHSGAHTLAVDEKTHDVWICYPDDKKAYLERIETK